MICYGDIQVRERATDKIKQVKQTMCLYFSSFTICHYDYRKILRKSWKNIMIITCRKMELKKI